MKALLSSVFGSSWKTTLAGYGTAAIIAAGDFLQANGDLSKLDLKALATAIGVALLGRFAKDHNITNAPAPAPAAPVPPVSQGH